MEDISIKNFIKSLSSSIIALLYQLSQQKPSFITMLTAWLVPPYSMWAARAPMKVLNTAWLQILSHHCPHHHTV